MLPAVRLRDGLVYGLRDGLGALNPARELGQDEVAPADAYACLVDLCPHGCGPAWAQHAEGLELVDGSGLDRPAVEEGVHALGDVALSGPFRSRGEAADADFGVAFHEPGGELAVHAPGEVVDLVRLVDDERAVVLELVHVAPGVVDGRVGDLSLSGPSAGMEDAHVEVSGGRRACLRVLPRELVVRADDERPSSVSVQDRCDLRDGVALAASGGRDDDGSFPRARPAPFDLLDGDVLIGEFLGYVRHGVPPAMEDVPPRACRKKGKGRRAQCRLLKRLKYT